METIKSSSTFIEQNPHNFSCNAITYMDRNHMQTFSNFTFQPKMQIPYDINNFGKWDKLANIYLDKATIKIKCCNLLRCLQILCLAPSTKMLPQNPLLHKCKSSCLDWMRYKMYVHGYDGKPMACGCKYFRKHNFALFHETPTSWKIIKEKDLHPLGRHASC
jgi:hypothetical protein